MKAQGGVEVEFYSFFNLGVRQDGWSTPRPDRFAPGNDPVPLVQEAGWAPRPAWRSAKNVASTGIRHPDRIARSESLNRLHLPYSIQYTLIYRLWYGSIDYTRPSAECGIMFSSLQQITYRPRLDVH